MLDNKQISDIIDQEIDFIGQLYVEYEQLTSYKDILSSGEKIRSLASLFYDFVDRIAHVLKNGEIIATSERILDLGARFRQELSITNIFSSSTIKRLQPFLELYNTYSQVYPDKIERSKIIAMYYQFPEITAGVALDLRTAAQNLRNRHAQ